MGMRGMIFCGVTKQFLSRHFHKAKSIVALIPEFLIAFHARRRRYKKIARIT
jgi:hypothetical protein